MNGWSIASIREFIPSQSQLDAAYKRGQEDAIRNYQKRKAVPKPEKPGAKSKAIDFSAMSDEEFDAYLAKARAGKV